MQIAGKLHRGFIPVRGGVRGKLPPDGTSHSQSKISPVAIKGGRESDCECMSQNTATDSRPQKTIKARQRRAATSRFSLLTCLRYLLQILRDLKSPLLRSAKGAFSTVTPWVAVSNYLSQLIADDLLIFPE